MLTKSVIIFAILVLLVQHFDAKPTLHSEKESTKKIRCFSPDKPHDMPQDVYEKYKISSKHLSEQDKKDFWNKFANWWKNVFAQIGKFFEKVGKFFENLFTKKQNQKESTTMTPTTEPPPTPSSQKMSKDKNVLICVEYETDPNDSDNMVTTKVYEIDVSSALTTNNEKLVTRISTNEDIITTVVTERVEEVTHQESNRGPESTPFDPNDDHKEKVPVIIGIENKAEVKKEENTDATIVRAV